MCSSSPTPAAPDYSGIATANAQASADAKAAADNDLTFRKQVYSDSLPRQQELYDLATKAANQQYGIAEDNKAHSDQQWKQYNDTYVPNEMQTAADAYGSQYLDDDTNKELTSILSGKSGLSAGDAQNRLAQISKMGEQAAGQEASTKSSADVNSAYAQAGRGLMRMGGDPNKIAAAAGNLANAQALARVGAGNAARMGARDKFAGMRTGVANFGRNMPNTALGAAGLAVNAGTSAVANQNTGYQSPLPYAGYVSGATGAQLGAAGIQQGGALGLGNIMSRDYGTQTNYASQANMAQGNVLGTVLGAGLTYGLNYGSDRRIKKNIEFVRQLSSGINLYEFEYKPEFTALWGTGRRLGVMADEVEKVVPAAVSIGPDGYKQVNYAMALGD